MKQYTHNRSQYSSNFRRFDSAYSKVSSLKSTRGQKNNLIKSNIQSYKTQSIQEQDNYYTLQGVYISLLDERYKNQLYDFFS